MLDAASLAEGPGVGASTRNGRAEIRICDVGYGAAAPNCCSTLTGMLKEKVDPSPGADSSQIRPPCISTMRLAMDNPSPLPPFVRVDELSACWNSPKILTWSAGSMPGPVSWTATVNDPFDADALMATLP